MDPYYFEKIIGILLKKMGYGQFQETSKSRDGGIDGVVNQDVLGLDKIYIQAKRFDENLVREKDIRNFIGAMSGDTSKGVFVTTSTYHADAEKKAKEAGYEIKVGKFPMMANSRAKTNRDTDGFVKVIADAKTDRVLGVHIIASIAGAMIAEACTAMEFGATSEDIAYTCHAHPTHAEALKEAAMAVTGKPIHM